MKIYIKVITHKDGYQMSELKVNKVSPRSGTDVQLGDSGDNITVPSGATLNASTATISALGGNLDVNGNDIISSSNQDIDIIPNGTGKTNFGGNAGIVLPSGTTAQRNTTSAIIRFNSTTGLAEYYDGTTFKSIDSPPTISSISPTTETDANANIVITGSNFASGATVKFIGDDGTEYTSPSVTLNSSTQITATTPSTALTVANEPYDIKVTNVSGLSATLADALDAGGSPTWSTASGNIGSVQENEAANFTVTATDPDGQTVSYSETTSVLSGAGFSLNSGTGAITGTAAAVSGDTTNTFTIRASDGTNTTDRSFNIITTENPIVQTNLNYDFRAVDYSGSAGTISSGTNVGSAFGSRINNSIFSGNTVTSYGNITFTTNDSYAPSGKCFTFTSDGAIQIKANSTANYNTYFNNPSSYTWVMWIDWDGSSRQGFYSRYGNGGDTDGNIKHFNHMMDSTTQFHYNQSGVNVGSGNETNGTWQITSGNQWQLIHITYDHTTGNQIWYVDGSQWGTASLSTNSGNGQSGYSNNTTPHTLGGRTDDFEQLSGKIAEARTYRAALTSSQVSAEWNGTKANYGRS